MHIPHWYYIKIIPPANIQINRVLNRSLKTRPKNQLRFSAQIIKSQNHSISAPFYCLLALNNTRSFTCIWCSLGRSHYQFIIPPRSPTQKHASAWYHRTPHSATTSWIITTLMGWPDGPRWLISADRERRRPSTY